MSSPIKGTGGDNHDPDNHLYHHPEAMDKDFWKNEANVKHMEDHKGVAFDPKKVKQGPEANHDHHAHDEAEDKKISDFIKNRFK